MVHNTHVARSSATISRLEHILAQYGLPRSVPTCDPIATHNKWVLARLMTGLPQQGYHPAQGTAYLAQLRNAHPSESKWGRPKIHEHSRLSMYLAHLGNWYTSCHYQYMG